MGVRLMDEVVPSGRVIWREKPRWPGVPVLVSGGSMVRMAAGVSRCWPCVVKRPGMADVVRARVGGGGVVEDGSASSRMSGESPMVENTSRATHGVPLAREESKMVMLAGR